MNTLYLSSQNLTHNYRVLRSKMEDKTQFIAVVKANAYGSALGAFVQHLVHLGVDALAVAYTEEGTQLRALGIQIPILVFYPQISTLSELVANNLEPCLYNQAVFLALKNILLHEGRTDYPVHLKYNTGLNRIGFLPEEAAWVFDQIRTAPFQIHSVYSHLAASEEKRPSTLSDQQIKSFQKIKSLHLEAITPQPYFHLLNSSGVFNYPEYQFDAVRCGIALHGYANKAEWDCELRPVGVLKSSICQITQVKKGASVGYDHGWVAPKDSSIATLPIGHADGIGRHFGPSQAPVYLHGKAVPIIGNVCMDMVMVDVTGVDCQLGDEVEIFGTHQNASEFALQANTISYELLTQLGPRIVRKWQP